MADKEIILGTQSNDKIVLKDSNHDISAFSGNNTITVGDGDNLVQADDGNNKLTLGDGQNQVLLGNGRNQIRAGTGNNQIVTGDGRNSISASDGDNTINAGSGNNRISLGDGNNQVLSGDGNDNITLGYGTNVVRAGGGQNKISALGDTDIETGDQDDQIRLGDGRHVIAAGAGRNKITVGDGQIELTSGDGADKITIGDATATISAGDGRNTIRSGDGEFNISTGKGNDNIRLGDGSGVVTAGDGTNRISAGDGVFSITAGNGNDQIKIGDADAEVHVGEGKNRITLGEGNYVVTSGSGNDYVKLSDATLHFTSSGGNNKLNAGDGDMIITTGAGNDNIRTGNGSITIDAGDGANRIRGGDGDFRITSGADKDDISLGDGSFVIQAGAGANRISVDDGELLLTTLDGNDQISMGDGVSEIHAGGGHNRISVGEGTHRIVASDGNNQIRSDDSNVSLTLGDGNNRISTKDGQAEVIVGSGNNTIRLGDGSAIVEAGDGDNRITVGAGDVSILTGDGNNRIRMDRGAEGFSNFITTGAGNDQISTNDADMEIDSGAGDDTIRAGDGNNQIHAGAGDDEVHGGAASDYLVGGAGNDRIDGGDGTDWAEFSGSFGDYFVEAMNASTVRVRSTSGTVSDIGIDDLRDIEYIYFAGDGFTLDVSDHNLLETLYEVDLKNDAVSSSTEGPLQITFADLLANDTALGQGSAVYQVSETSASGLALSFDGTTVTYNSDDALRHLTDGEVFTDSFTYTVTDANGNSDTATVNVTVTGESNGPVAEDDLLTGGGEASGADGGNEFRVNNDGPYADRHSLSSAVTTASGATIVVWSAGGNSFSDIRASIVGPDGTELVDEFIVTDDSGASDVSLLPDGKFVVVWGALTEYDYENGYDDHEIRGRIFNADGTPAGEQFPIVEVLDYAFYLEPRITTLENGNFVVVWSEEDPASGELSVFGKICDPTGAVIADKFHVPSGTPNGGWNSQIEATPDGGFVVTWQERDAIKAAVFDASGNTVVPEIQINPATHTGSLVGSAVDVHEDGSIVVIWNDLIGSVGTVRTLYASVINPDGSTAVATFEVTNISNGVSEVAFLPNGQFVVSWSQSGDGPTIHQDIWARIYNADGSPATEEFIVNERTANSQFPTEIVALDNDNFMITWDSREPGQHTESNIAGRIFDFNGEPVKDYFVSEDEAAEIDVQTLLANDEVDGATFSLDGLISANGASLSYDAATGLITYDPTAAADLRALAEGETLEDSFTYTLTDANGNTDTATVTLTVGGTDGVSITVPNTIDDRLTGAPSNFRAIEGEGEFTLSGIGVATAPHPQVVARKGGGFISAWKTNNGGQTGVAVRVVDAEGNDVRSQFLANEGTDGSLNEFELTELEDGGFALVWRTNGVNNPDVDTHSTMRIFNADGSPRTGEISLVNSEGDDFANFRVTGLSDGNILVTSIGTTYPSGAYETRSGFGGRIYSPNGDMLGQSVAMGLDDFPDQGTLQAVSVEALETGGFITLWATGTISGRSTTVVQAGIFDSAGQEVVTNLEITTRSVDSNLGALSNLQVSANENGSFVVTWREISTDAGIEARMVGKVFNPDGSAASEKFTFYKPAVAGTTEYADNGDVTWVSAEQFVVTWSAPDSSRGGTYAQVYNADGTPATESVRVNESEHYHQIYSSVASLNDGRFIISWYSN